MLVCKQRRHGQLPYLGITPRDFTMACPARHSGRYCNPMAERKDFWQLAPMGGAYPWHPLRSLCCHLDNRSRECLGSSSCSAPPFPHDPALHGDFRNPHSLNLTCLHQRRRDGNKSYPSETKTVQILLWPGRRPSVHFNHFETYSLT